VEPLIFQADSFVIFGVVSELEEVFQALLSLLTLVFQTDSLEVLILDDFRVGSLFELVILAIVSLLPLFQAISEIFGGITVSL